MSLDSIKPGGDGMVSSVRVRLLHSTVRKRILKLAEAKPEYYDVDKYGIPVNDLDDWDVLDRTDLAWAAQARYLHETA
jgi:hypothetical protein